MRFLLRLLVSSAIIFGIGYLSHGRLLHVASFWPSAVAAALVLAIVNALVRPIVHILSLPITILTLGLFSLVINALMLMLVAAVVPGVDTVGFLQTLVAALIIALASSAVMGFIEEDDRR